MGDEHKDEKGKVLNDDERAALLSHIRALGLEAVAKASEASELALAKAAAGIPASRGTVATCREYLRVATA
jgi:hypothetical protein